MTGDELIQKFWELEEVPMNELNPTPEEKSVMQNFIIHHSRTTEGGFVVSLPRKADAKPLGESRSQAVRRFLYLERSLHSKNQFKELVLSLKNILIWDTQKWFPFQNCTIHINWSTIFQYMLSARSPALRLRSGVYSMHRLSPRLVSSSKIPCWLDPLYILLLLSFRLHRIALTTDISKMYRAIELALTDHDYHHFVWRKSPKDLILDYQMIRVRFGVSASLFISNMAIK